MKQNSCNLKSFMWTMFTLPSQLICVFFINADLVRRRCLNIDIYTGLLYISNKDIGFTAGVSDRQGLLTHPK